jgi:predicted enzyme related to lactoylglutathione lyase
MSRAVHYEIPADQPERGLKFYKKVFGWYFEKRDGPIKYGLVRTGPEDQPGIDGGLDRREDTATGLENTIDPWLFPGRSKIPER